MLTNILIAGLAGVLVPLALERLGADPAVASSVFVTMVTDSMGFLVFLGLATGAGLVPLSGLNSRRCSVHLGSRAEPSSDQGRRRLRERRGAENRVARRARQGEVRVPTRMRPKRMAELVGGSLHWIVKHRIVARQEILRFDDRSDGRIDIVCAAELVACPAPAQARPPGLALSRGR